MASAASRCHIMKTSDLFLQTQIGYGLFRKLPVLLEASQLMYLLLLSSSLTWQCWE